MECAIFNIHTILAAEDHIIASHHYMVELTQCFATSPKMGITVDFVEDLTPEKSHL